MQRIYSGGGGGYDDPQYNKIYLFSLPFRAGNSQFVEGFTCKKFVIEGRGATHSFRKQTLTPQLLYDIDKFIGIGDEYVKPQLRGVLSLTPAPFGLKVNDEAIVFGIKFQYCDASHGIEIEVWNGQDLGNNTNLKFYDRSVNATDQRNVIDVDNIVSTEPPPAHIIEPIYHDVEAKRV